MIRKYKASVHCGSTIVTTRLKRHGCFINVKILVVGVSYLPHHFPVTAPLMISGVAIGRRDTITTDVVMVEEVATGMMIVRVI